jgi:hypothetical protein
MTVAELRKLTEALPDDTRVLVPAYEGGYTEPRPREAQAHPAAEPAPFEGDWLICAKRGQRVLILDRTDQIDPDEQSDGCREEPN